MSGRGGRGRGGGFRGGPGGGRGLCGERGHASVLEERFQQAPPPPPRQLGFGGLFARWSIVATAACLLSRKIKMQANNSGPAAPAK